MSLFTPEVHDITVCTTTTGNPDGLSRLLDSIEAQGIPVTHLLLWDGKRHPDAKDPAYYESKRRHSIVFPNGQFAPINPAQEFSVGPSPMGLGMLLAKTKWLTWADDDVWWEKGHIEALVPTLTDPAYAYTLRRVWHKGECLGVDRAESVGHHLPRKFSYAMTDSNTMLVRRDLAINILPHIMATAGYDGDRIMYQQMRLMYGDAHFTWRATINQECPERLAQHFQSCCELEAA